MLQFAKFLLENYTTNADVKKLLDGSRVHLMPTMNPDGYAKTLKLWPTGKAEGTS